MHAPEIRASLSNNTGGLLEQSGKSLCREVSSAEGALY